MNFAERIKAEILSKNIRDKHCRQAFLAGIIRGSGVLYERDGELGLEFKAPDEQTAMTFTNSFKVLYDYDIREVSVSEDKLNKKDKFLLNVSGERAEDILISLGVLEITDDGELAVNLKLYGPITEKECCLRAFIRGLFVAVGNITIPTDNDDTSTGYHLDLTFSHYSTALETSEKLAEYGIITKITKRRDSYIVYIKSAEEIKDFIAFLPAPVSVLKFTDVMINRELNNISNRQKNCDLGNVNRQIEASEKQIQAIKKIASTIGLETLKPDLKITATVRLDNPEETLTELAERLNVSKSCLNHRLRKLVCIANEL